MYKEPCFTYLNIPIVRTPLGPSVFGQVISYCSIIILSGVAVQCEHLSHLYSQSSSGFWPTLLWCYLWRYKCFCLCSKCSPKCYTCTQCVGGVELQSLGQDFQSLLKCLLDGIMSPFGTLLPLSSPLPSPLLCVWILITNRRVELSTMEQSNLVHKLLGTRLEQSTKHICQWSCNSQKTSSFPPSSLPSFLHPFLYVPTVSFIGHYLMAKERS